MFSLPFPSFSLSSYSSFFISQRSSHSHVRVAGLFLSPSQPRPTGNPLRPWSSTRPFLFLLLQSLISFSFIRSSSTSVSLLPPPPSLLQASSSSAPVTLSEFLENIEEGSRGTFWDQCLRDCPTSRFAHFTVLVVAAVRYFSFSVPEFPAHPSKSRRKSGIIRFITESAAESTLTTTTAVAMITRLKRVSYLRDIYLNNLISCQDF